MKPRVAQKVRDLVYARDGMACAMCGTTYQLTLHHRRTAGMGGTKRPESHGPQNLVVLCGSGTTGCHGLVTSEPERFRSPGYVVRQGFDPADVPLIWHGQLVFLCADGTVQRVGEEAS